MGENLLRLLLKQATDTAIMCLDLDLRITCWSSAARDMFGYEEAEILGRRYDTLFTPEDHESGAPSDEVSRARHEGRVEDERWHQRKDGSRFYASGVLTWVGEGASVAYVKAARELPSRERTGDEHGRPCDGLGSLDSPHKAGRTNDDGVLHEPIDNRHDLLRRLVNAQEGERRRIARDLHDGLGQELTALMLGLGNLREELPRGSTPWVSVGRLEEIASRIGREARSLVTELRPPSLDDFGLYPALRSYIAGWSERTGVEATFRIIGTDDPLSPDVETMTYRIVQESLNNVARHAEARHVCVILEHDAEVLTALVEDDGRGFDPDGVADHPPGRARPLGLIGMRDRVALLGGDLVIESAEGEGTTIRARIPLD